MSRILKKRRKRYAGLTEDRISKQDHHFQSAVDKCEKIFGKLTSDENYPFVENQERLAGGADNVEDTETSSSAVLQPHEQSGEGGENAPASSSAPEPPPKSISERNVNEMIDYVIEHLKEAGKALSDLSGDHEHDLKLMLVEVMVKLQNKIDVIQNKVDSGLNELNELRKQLASRNSEVEDLMTKLAEAEAMKMAHEKVIADSKLKISDVDQSSPAVPTPQTLGQSTPVSTGHTQGVDPKNQLTAEGPITPGLSPRVDSEVHLDGSITIPSGIAALPGDAPIEIRGSLQRDGSGNIQGNFEGNIQGNFPVNIQGSFIGNIPEMIQEDGHGDVDRGQAGTQRIQTGIQRIQGGIQEKPDASMYREGVITGIGGGPGVSSQPRPGDPTGPSTIPIEQLSHYDGHYAKSDIGGQRNQREIELENECQRLRRENERIMKERADYENAIQRAVLKGVSSLNVETLKVLKNPPISCCTPCPPCNDGTESNTATNILCPRIIKDNWSSQREKSALPSKFDGIFRQKEKSSRCVKKQAPSVCYSSGIDNKASQDSMIFLVPQQNDTCNQYPRFCARPNSAGTKSICPDGKYRKSSSKERNYCSGKVQKSGNEDVCPVSVRDYSRTMNCTDIFTTAARYESHDTKRCDPCNRIRRIFDN